MILRFNFLNYHYHLRDDGDGVLHSCIRHHNRDYDHDQLHHQDFLLNRHQRRYTRNYMS